MTKHVVRNNSLLVFELLCNSKNVAGMHVRKVDAVAVMAEPQSLWLFLEVQSYLMDDF